MPLKLILQYFVILLSYRCITHTHITCAYLVFKSTKYLEVQFSEYKKSYEDVVLNTCFSQDFTTLVDEFC